MMITDGTYICKLCGESLTGCSLCGEAPLLDMRPQLSAKYQAERDAEIELGFQEKSIRDAAEKRRMEMM